MLFSSITFLFIFLPLTLLLYYLVPFRMKNYVMLAASLIFYAWGEPVYIILMILSIILNYFCGQDIYEKRDNARAMKMSLMFGVVMNLLILGFFKYYGLLMDTINAILPIDIPYRVLALPIGISFYTFQAMSYLIDVYRKEVKPQENVLYFALYISMFPQLIAGPIVRYIDIEEQLKERSINSTKFGEGAMYFIRGLAKKVVLANTFGSIYEQVAAMQMGSFSTLTAWVGAIAYAFQIYFDFGGYSDMAIGLGKQKGAESIHHQSPAIMHELIEEYGRTFIDNVPIIGGIAVIENAYDETYLIKGLTPQEIITEEPKLKELSYKTIAHILFDKCDVLVVDKIGKNISGDGMDPNISGRLLRRNSGREVCHFRYYR